MLYRNTNKQRSDKPIVNAVILSSDCDVGKIMRRLGHALPLNLGWDEKDASGLGWGRQDMYAAIYVDQQVAGTF